MDRAPVPQPEPVLLNSEAKGLPVENLPPATLKLLQASNDLFTNSFIALVLLNDKARDKYKATLETSHYGWYEDYQILGNSSSGVPGKSIWPLGLSYGEDLFINDTGKYAPVYDRVYARFLEEAQREVRHIEVPEERQFHILKALQSVSRGVLIYDDDWTLNFISQRAHYGNHFTELAHFIFAQKGVCRQQAYLGAYLGSRLTRDQTSPLSRDLVGSFNLRRYSEKIDAHAFFVFTSADGTYCYEMDIADHGSDPMLVRIDPT